MGWPNLDILSNALAKRTVSLLFPWNGLMGDRRPGNSPRHWMCTGFIHGRGNYHGDVKDLHIVVKYKDGNLEAKLTDFGSARRIGEEMNRFIGTPAFAHKHLHEKSKWHCKAQYELTSLGFTLVTTLNEGIVPWAGFSRKPEGDDILKKLAKTRQEAAKEILTKDG
mmetsp:Transcript_28468/g.78201  ORF Transcript_28468/g.78201 Transcript_28468/m.78201 type:complete len:166 (-) Transcript_28468:324-821(-)